MAKRKCEKCSGYGVIDCPYCGGGGWFSKPNGDSVRCESCGKRGNGPGQFCCDRCDGKGEI